MLKMSLYKLLVTCKWKINNVSIIHYNKVDWVTKIMISENFTHDTEKDVIVSVIFSSSAMNA